MKTKTKTTSKPIKSDIVTTAQIRALGAQATLMGNAKTRREAEKSARKLVKMIHALWPA